MADWLSYSLSDFLMFTPDTYCRLFELHNAAVWPAQLLAGLAAAAIAVLLWRQPPWQGRAIAAILAAAWLFVGWVFLLERYTTVLPAAVWLAWLFFAQGALLAWLALRRDPPRFALSDDAAGRLAILLLAVALVLQPLAGPLGGRPWTGAELFAIAPDPTASATIAVLLLASGRGAWPLLVLPLAWCLISGLTLAAMDSPHALLMPVFGLLAVCGAFMGSRRA